MGSGTFFSKLASVDPLAQALHLPGATKYRQQAARNDAGTSGGGPYAGVTPTLAGANAGYLPGGPGANEHWQQWAPHAPGGALGFAQHFASAVGGTTPNPADGNFMPSNPGQIGSTFKSNAGYAAPPGINPYAGAAGAQRPVGMNATWQQVQISPMQSR